MALSSVANEMCLVGRNLCPRVPIQGC